MVGDSDLLVSNIDGKRLGGAEGTVVVPRIDGRLLEIDGADVGISNLLVSNIDGKKLGVAEFTTQ